MEPFIRDVYLREICTQVDAARIAAADLNVSLTRLDAEGLGSDALDRAFLAAQSFISCCALVSKLIWTAEDKSRAKRRARELQELLGLTGIDTPLSSRLVRNQIEHFDDRLDAACSGRSVVVDRIIGPEGSTVVVQGMSPQKFLRRLDPETMTFSVLGHSAKLQSLMDELNRIDALAKRIMS